MPNAPGGGGSPPKKKPSEKTIFIDAERQQESGGDYLVVNAGSGALGAWQVMPSNLPGWLKESGQKPMSSYAYLHCASCQNKLAWVILGGAYDKYGARGAAAWWYCGKPTPDATYGNPPVYQYVNDVIALMKKGGFTVNTGGQGSGPGSYTLPPPNEGDWSAAIRAAAKSHRNAGNGLAQYASALSKLR